MKTFIVTCLLSLLTVGISQAQDKPQTDSTPVRLDRIRIDSVTDANGMPVSVESNSASNSANFFMDGKPIEHVELAASADDDKEVALIKTSAGDMVIDFWTDAAPKTIENFKKLAKSGFYDGTCFHRIIKGFMIQGGDPDSKNTNASPGSFGGGGPGYNIKAEFNDHPHVRGVISMARSSDPDSAGSQFFICLGRAESLDHQYTSFGKLIKGDDILGKLGDSPCTGPNSMGEYSIPKPRVELVSIKIVKASSVK